MACIDSSSGKHHAADVTMVSNYRDVICFHDMWLKNEDDDIMLCVWATALSKAT